MQPTLRTQLLGSIAKVYEVSKDCKLRPEIFTDIEPELRFISDYFKVSNIQSFFIANIFTINYRNNSTDMADLIAWLDCNPIRLLEYADEFDALTEKGIIKKSKSNYHKGSFSEEQLKINEKITAAVLKNQSLPLIEPDSFNDFIELIENLHKLSEQRDEGEISTGQLFVQADFIIRSNLQYPMLKRLYELSMNIRDMYVFLYMTWKTVSYEKSTGIKRMCDEIFDRSTDGVKYAQTILGEENILIKKDLIEIQESTFFDDADIILTDKATGMLNDCGLKLPTKKKSRSNILMPDGIPFRKLIFNKTTCRELGLFKALLGHTHFKETQTRLEQQHLPVGIAALFHGTPGTGKTETALQTAKETGRPILKVDISQQKSLWFGESEKTVKRIFTEYKEFSKDCEQTPILLFNEADAIFSKRRDIGTSSVAQTENAIQNILLEELEHFDGIMIATTNMITNLDTAFDRRFLFKIQFEKPDIQSRSEIWKLKLPELSQVECERLAKAFDFSGGQIDNIIRKYQIESIIHQSDLCFEKILEFCNYENPDKEKNLIGFNK